MSDNIQVKTEDDVRRHKPVKLFGKDLMEITCFRNSFICGICTGVAGGLGTFLFTSKALFSTHMALASLWVGVFAYWIPCRYKYENEMLLVADFKMKQTEKLKNLGNVSESEQ